MGWYLPVQVVKEKVLSGAGVKVVVQMKRVAVGRAPGGSKQAVGIRTRREWCRHSISREEVLGPLGLVLGLPAPPAPPLHVLFVSPSTWPQAPLQMQFSLQTQHQFPGAKYELVGVSGQLV